MQKNHQVMGPCCATHGPFREHLPSTDNLAPAVPPYTTHGFIVANTNCAATGVAVPLAALKHAFGPLDTMLITTIQAVSGAGYPSVLSLNILDNVMPYIGGEEDKLVEKGYIKHPRTLSPCRYVSHTQHAARPH